MNLLIIDCENCSFENIKKQIETIIDTDIIMIVGALQVENKYKCLSDNIETIKSNKVFQNAADFVLISVLSQRLSQHKYKKAIIMSNDRGFDSAVNYLTSIGYNVTRHESANLIMSKGLDTICKFIVDNYKSGASYARIVKAINAEIKGGKTRKLLNELHELGIITIAQSKVRQIYFSEKRLREISSKITLEVMDNGDKQKGKRVSHSNKH